MRQIDLKKYCGACVSYIGVRNEIHIKLYDTKINGKLKTAPLLCGIPKDENSVRGCVCTSCLMKNVCETYCEDFFNYRKSEVKRLKIYPDYCYDCIEMIQYLDNIDMVIYRDFPLPPCTKDFAHMWYCMCGRCDKRKICRIACDQHKILITD